MPAAAFATNLRRPWTLGACQGLQPDTRMRKTVGCTVNADDDVQHADIDDGRSFHGVPRYYRGALEVLSRAVTDWKARNVEFAIHFGDILDGFQQRSTSSSAEDALSAVLDVFGKLGAPVYHMIGNHCLYNMPRPVLHERLGILPAPHGASYYSLEPHDAWRVIVLDGYDISVLGWPEGHPHREEALVVLHKNNPNKGNLNSPEGLVGVSRRYVAFGGGVSATQLEWLGDELKAAAAAGQRCIVCGHLPLCPGTCAPACLLWNYEEVLGVLRRSDCVAATIAGHAHQNGYVVDEWGIHHVVLPGIVETPPGRNAHGFIEVFDSELVLHGADTLLSCHMALRPHDKSRMQSTAGARHSGHAGLCPVTAG